MKKQITPLLAALFLLAAAGNDLVAQPRSRTLTETPTNFYTLQEQSDRLMWEEFQRINRLQHQGGMGTQGVDTRHLTYLEELGLLRSPYFQQLEDFQNWAAFIEPRLYPSGDFIDASDIMMGEIRRLQKGGRLSGAKLPQSCSPMASWSNLGPFHINSNTPQHNTDAAGSGLHKSYTPGLGRINFVKKHPTQNALYIGASNGGLWKSEDAGLTWELATSDLSITGLSDLIFSPDGTVMYLATGDRSRGGMEAIGLTTYSLGVLKSTDGGLTWASLADQVYWETPGGAGELTVSNLVKINRIALNASGGLLACTGDNHLTSQPDAGIWKYEPQPDGPGGGTVGHWVLKHGTGRQPVKEMLVLPGNVVVAATSENNGSSYERLFRSTDGGEAYSLVSSGGFPTPVPDPMTGKVDPFVGNVGMAYSNGVLYIMFINSLTGQFGGLHRSVDAGQTFEEVTVSPTSFIMSGIGDGIRRLGFTVNPLDENELYVSGSMEIWKLSLNEVAGMWLASAAKVSTYLRDAVADDEQYVHPDVQAFEWDGNTLYAAHDGGLSKTSDYGATWSKWYELTGDLCISEVYRMGGLPGSADVLFAGTHDDGVFRYNAAAATGEPFWLNIIGGDMLKPYPQAADELFVCTGAGDVKHGSFDGSSWSWSTSDPPIGEKHGNGVNLPFYQSPDDAEVLYLGYANLWKSVDGGGSWGKTTDFPQPLLGPAYTRVINVMAMSPSDANVMYFSKRMDENEFLNAPDIPLIYRSADCTATATVTVSDDSGQCSPGPCTAAIKGDLVVCDGSVSGGGGTTTLTASGGTGYLWEDGSTDAVRTNVGEGSYAVTVTDGVSCTATASAAVVGAGSGCGGVLCTAVIKGDLVVCDGSGSGPTTTTLTASGGTSYLWEDGSTDAVRTNVGVGEYSVTVTDGAGSSWDLVYDGTNPNPGDNLPQLHLNQLAVHPFDPDKLWAVFSGYEAGERVYESADGGATWRNVSGELPPLPVNAVAAFAEDPGDPGSLVHLVVGTDLSVYYSNETLLSCSGGAQWFDFGQGLPYIIVQELEVHGAGANRVLRAATFGRGIWETPLPDASGCTCGTCTDPEYPLVADFEIGSCSYNDPEVGWWGPPAGGYTVGEYQLIEIVNTSLGEIDTYSWDFDGGQFFLYEENPNGGYWETPGTKTVSLTVTDVNGCTSSTSQTFEVNPWPCTLDYLPVGSIVEPVSDCTGTNDCGDGAATGEVSINLPLFGGSGCYGYAVYKETPTGYDELVEDVSGTNISELLCLEEGNYEIVVTDYLSGCSVSEYFTMQPPAYTYISVVEPVVVGCNGEQVQNATIEIFPQTPDCTATISGTTDSYFSFDISTSGVHEYTIQYANATSETISVEVPEEEMGIGNSHMYVNVETVHVQGGCNDEITIAASNDFGSGVNGFTYGWSDCPSCTQPQRTGLCEGDYYITVTDNLTGCSIVRLAKIRDAEQPVVLLPPRIYAFLEGLVDISGNMSTTLETKSLLPIHQPYNQAPWGYSGTDSVASVNDFPYNTVDWILLEARDSDDPNVVLDRTAALLLADGSIAAPKGGPAHFKNIPEGEELCYIVIRHRNHLDVMSSVAKALYSGEETKYDFCESQDRAMGAGQQSEPWPGVFALHAGDFNGDGVISVSDYNRYQTQMSAMGQYLDCDADLDGNVLTNDYNLYKPNASIIGISPIRY